MSGLRFLLVLGLLVAPWLWAQDPQRIGAVEFDRSDRYLMPSTHVGDTFRIDVILPLGYEASEDRYPVVYVTDSNYLLFAAVASYLAQATDEFSKMIIVGVGWDVPSITRIRVRDFSPSCDPNVRKELSLGDDECGGADKFASYLARELQPFINDSYRTTGNSTLVGYSFGGLFAAHVLFNHTDAFDRYLIGSPSLYWDDGIISRSEAKYAQRASDLNKQVYLSVGGLEGSGVIPSTYLLYEQLLDRQYPGLQIEMEVIEGETHMTSISPFVLRGLRSVGFAR